MENFSIQIENFKKFGTYDYKFDEYGNLIINSSSSDFYQNYISLPIKTVNYKEKLTEFYSIEFEEFLPPTEEEQSEILSEEQQENIVDVLIEEKEQLESQLNDLIERSENFNSESDTLAIKQVILELRKKLNEGVIDEDFSEDFPYTSMVEKKLENR